MKSFRKFLIALLIMFPLVALAQNNYQPSVFVKPDARTKGEVVEAFKYYKNVTPSIQTPSVLEIPFTQEYFSLPVFAIYNLNTSLFEPYLLSVNNINEGGIEISNGLGRPASLGDGDYETYVEFPLTGEASRAEITFRFNKPITASSLSFALDNYVSLPKKVSINADVNGTDTIVLAPTRPYQENEMFPKTTSAVWKVAFEYVQPLRISEMKFNDLSPNQLTSKGLRFLAQPGQSYEIYFDADRYVASSKKEAGDLFSSKGVVYSGASGAIRNPFYKAVDSDEDGVPNLSDNCISVANMEQTDKDMNGLGDACEDYDRDGVLGGKDNCPEMPNSGQMDTDADGVGDVCDTFEDRVTERMPWLPWFGIGIAGAVILFLFALVLRHKPEEKI